MKIPSVPLAKPLLAITAVLALFLAGLTTLASAALLLEENFDYQLGNLEGQGGWILTGGIITNPMQVVSPSLTYPGYPSSGVGNAAGVAVSGQDVNRVFTPTVPSGSLYYACLVNVSYASTTGDYFIHFGYNPNPGSGFFGKLFCRADGSGNVAFAASKLATTFLTYTPAAYPLNTTHLLVVKYTLNTGSSNDDAVSLWVNPVIGVSEPPADLTGITDTGNDPDPTKNGLGSICLRQGGSSTYTTQVVDGIRVATSWSEVLMGDGGGGPDNHASLTGAAALSCNGTDSPAEGVTVRLLNEGEPFLETATDGDGAYEFPEVLPGTYVVAVVPPPGYGITADTRLITIPEGTEALPLDPWVFTCLLRDLVGRVDVTCNGTVEGAHGVTVDLFHQDGDGVDMLVGTTATDAWGSFQFDDLALGSYSLHVVTPLGYVASTTSQEVALTSGAGPLASAPFSLTCATISGQPRSLGYWKHQVDAHLTGKGQAQESLDALLGYTALIVEHFNENIVNPITIYVPTGGGTTEELGQLQALLTVNRGGTMLDRAKQQLLALFLNVVSAKIGQSQLISGDGASVSQAITYCNELIVDGDPSTDETAKTIADLINNGQPVPSGMIPMTTQEILYRRNPDRGGNREASFLGNVYPNPTSGAFTIAFSLTARAATRLELFDVSGRRVLAEDLGTLGSGNHTWRLENGRLSTGSYLIRLTHGARSACGSIRVIG